MAKEKDDSRHTRVNYNQITDNIFIGTNFCCMTHFDEELLDMGITADISLENTRVDSPFGVESYLWLPVEDHTPPTPYQFELGVSALEKSVEAGQKVYVHCRNGHGRAPTMVAAFLIKKRDMAPEEAIEFIKSKRPEIHLEGTQKEALHKFYKK